MNKVKFPIVKERKKIAKGRAIGGNEPQNSQLSCGKDMIKKKEATPNVLIMICHVKAVT